MLPEQIISEIKRLTVSQKLLMAQDIWDSIAIESGNIPMPAWQKDGLKKRYNEYKNGKVSLHDWQEVHARLRET
ncbi:MAG: addiction module protein [Desulfobacteraceae bacterium]|jgi:putative addiction module component (TIGR02574 family)|nr:addiction module protein [Desulfobacteraceae bacterium]